MIRVRAGFFKRADFFARSMSYKHSGEGVERAGFTAIILKFSRLFPLMPNACHSVKEGWQPEFWKIAILLSVFFQGSVRRRGAMMPCRS